MCTTSDYCPDSYAFARDKPLSLIFGAKLQMVQLSEDRHIQPDSYSELG